MLMYELLALCRCRSRLSQVKGHGHLVGIGRREARAGDHPSMMDKLSASKRYAIHITLRLLRN